MWAERQEEKRRLREEKVVRGVDLDATKLGDGLPEEDEDLTGLAEAIERGGTGERSVSGAGNSGAEAQDSGIRAQAPENRQTGTMCLPAPSPFPHSEDGVEESPFGEEELSAVRRAVRGTAEPEETVYLKKDTRTLREMNLGGGGFQQKFSDA